MCVNCKTKITIRVHTRAGRKGVEVGNVESDTMRGLSFAIQINIPKKKFLCDPRYPLHMELTCYATPTFGFLYDFCPQNHIDYLFHVGFVF